MAISPISGVPPLNRVGVDSPSTSMSFHWSNTVSLQVPLGRPDMDQCPAPSHFVNAKSSPSASPMLTKHWVKAKLSLVPLPYNRSSGVRLIRSVDTNPFTVFVQLLAGRLRAVPAHLPACVPMVIFGPTKANAN